MGSIPLPQLDIRPPVVPNALDQQTKALQLAALTQRMRTEKLTQDQMIQENQLRQQQIQDTMTARQMASDPKYLTKDQNGNVTGFDYDKLTADLGPAGVGPATLTQYQTLRKNSADAFLLHQQGLEAATKNQQNLLTQAYGKLEDYKALSDPNDRAANWAQLLDWGKQNGADVAHLPTQPPTNDQLGPIEAGLGMHAQAINDAKARADNQKAAASALLEQNKADMITAYKNNPNALLSQVDTIAPASTYGPLNSRTRFAVNQALSMGDVDAAKEAIKSAGQEVGAIEKETNPTVQAGKIAVAGATTTARVKAEMDAAQAAGGGMNQAAIDQAAEYYHLTGKLPPGGRGVAGLAQNRQIMNRAGELYPGSMTQDSAEYKANQASLTGLQKQFDQVTAFENTAGKNLDVFLGTAKKVIDTGSPWVNSPLRSVDQNLLGSDDQAAFNAARTTALTEIAKVLNSSNASGVLSDSARQEVEGLIGKDASLSNIVKAAGILKQDMANRHQSYQEQINDIQRRLPGQKTGTTPGAGGTTPPFDFKNYPTHQ